MDPSYTGSSRTDLGSRTFGVSRQPNRGSQTLRKGPGMGKEVCSVRESWMSKTLGTVLLFQ